MASKILSDREQIRNVMLQHFDTVPDEALRDMHALFVDKLGQTGQDERVKQARLERDAAMLEARELRLVIARALARYDDPNEKHNKDGGFPRGELAWAMAADLREVQQ